MQHQTIWPSTGYNSPALPFEDFKCSNPPPHTCCRWSSWVTTQFPVCTVLCFSSSHVSPGGDRSCDMRRWHGFTGHSTAFFFLQEQRFFQFLSFFTLVLFSPENCTKDLNTAVWRVRFKCIKNILIWLCFYCLYHLNHVRMLQKNNSNLTVYDYENNWVIKLTLPEHLKPVVTLFFINTLDHILAKTGLLPNLHTINLEWVLIMTRTTVTDYVNSKIIFWPLFFFFFFMFYTKKFPYFLLKLLTITSIIRKNIWLV